MNIFGENWSNHEEKIKKDWMSKVKPEDTVIHPGDFSWAMYLKDTVKTLLHKAKYVRGGGKATIK